jgi:hypothetical protein
MAWYAHGMYCVIWYHNVDLFRPYSYDQNGFVGVIAIMSARIGVNDNKWWYMQ